MEVSQLHHPTPLTRVCLRVSSSTEDVQGAALWQPLLIPPIPVAARGASQTKGILHPHEGLADRLRLKDFTYLLG